jgi:hypothetical protein
VQTSTLPSAGHSSAIRRIQASAGGSAAGYAARAGWLARGLGGGSSNLARRAMAAGILGLHNPEDELSMDDDDLWESVMHGVGDLGHYRQSRGANANNNDHHPDLPILMDIGDAGSAALSRTVESSRQRYLEAARAYSLANREAIHAPPLSAPPAVDADALLQAATSNAASYQPHWVANPASLIGSGRTLSHHARVAQQGDGRVNSSRSATHGTNLIQVGDVEDRRNLAHVPAGGGEGRAIRAEEPLPRSESLRASGSVFASFRAASANSGATIRARSPSDDDLKRRAFGFRVAFDHPTLGDVVGANMGGCYLVGVTTASFTAYGDQDMLRQSPFFWGIEDGGQVYEGPRHSGVGTSGRPDPPRRSSGAVVAESATATAAALYALDGIPGAASTMASNSSEAQLNAHGVLFGARQVVSVVCDIELRTLTFWRDETLLGTLVTNLPRSGNLYPVAVPFNCGVSVAITGLDGDPLEM